MDVFLVKLLILTSVITSTAFAQSGTDVNNLLTYLFTTKGYNKKVRPLLDQTQTMNIDTDFVLNSVIDFDEQEECMKTSGYLYFTWLDQYLSWTPSAYNDIYDLFVPQDDIWKPDVSLANSFKTFTGMGASYLNIRIYYTGLVEWKPYQGSCNWWYIAPWYSGAVFEPKHICRFKYRVLFDQTGDKMEDTAEGRTLTIPINRVTECLYK